jgi:nucleotide-binding universal stress UspA family protein
MLDSFLVVLEDKADALIPYAISAAKALDAFPTAVWPRRDRTGFEDGSLEARFEAASGAAPTLQAHARDGLAAFSSAAERAGVAAETLEPQPGKDPPRDLIPRYARAFDFAMVQQREPGRVPARDDLTAALLAESGRPVWVVPAIQREPAAFKRIMVAWDGGATAARAFSEAKRVFKHAERVDIVTVSGPQTHSAVYQGGERLALRLRRAGVAAEYRRLPSDEDAANALLSYAADMGADLMVSGGYSHSPLRESLFGGATRTLLTSMTVPMFFAH